MTNQQDGMPSVEGHRPERVAITLYELDEALAAVIKAERLYRDSRGDDELDAARSVTAVALFDEFRKRNRNSRVIIGQII